MIKKSASRLSLFLLVLTLTFSAFGRSVKMSVDSRGPIGVGDKFYISITVTDIHGRPNIGSSTKISGARVLYFTDTGSGSSSTIINGHAESSFYTRYTITCQATEKGTHSFGPVTVDGVKSNTVTFNVGGGGQRNASPSMAANTGNSGGKDSSSEGPKFIGTGNGNLFLRANASKTKVYEQEAIVYTVKLYSTYSNIRFVGATSSPKFDGFVVEESKDISSYLTFENYQGKQYASAVIARYIIFPQMKGSLKVSGNTYTVSVDEREYYRDQFWGTMSVSRPIQLNVKPNDLNIEVMPLPSPQPADFSGGVGQFSISSSLPSSSLKTNEAASVTYTVSGTGNLKYIKLPDLNPLFPKELEVFTPETKVNAKVSGSSVSGNVVFDCSLMPLETGSYDIPPVNLVYFNPTTGKYETATAKGYTVNVAQGKASSRSQTNSVVKFNDKLRKTGELSHEHPAVTDSWTYWLWYVVPLLILSGVIIAYRKRIKAYSDISALRSRKAGKIAAKKLAKARKMMESGNEETFYDEMLASLWGYIGDKLKMPTSELSRDNISAQLEERGIDKEIISRWLALVDECEFAKYAPSAVSGGMNGIYENGVKIINLLESKFKKG